MLIVFTMLVYISTFQGRNPFYLDPAMVICITDGGRLTWSDGVNQTVGSGSSH